MSPPRSADAFFAALHEAIGGRLFTITVLDRDAGLARRAYSSHPEAYPVSGTKPMAQGAWTDMVVARGEVFVANSVAEFAIYFPDHALIESLGCGAALNVPIRNGPVIGTVNVLDVAGAFSPPVVTRICAEIAAQEDALRTHLEDLAL
ncbi:GAF domain-containing protein [Dinoroseobacter sp. S375]|uniref:GAF domain-containing protein n=1 Tax=Dinoroseobacter sp. S375 TaxID=3415136 RepID=UPI003C7A75EF